MEAKHTPGPWNVPQPIITNAGLPFSPVCANTLIAKVYSTAFGDHAQSEANARLIAAAPELLEALESFLRAPSSGSAGMGSVNLVVQEFNLRAARVAIAKATENKP
jgi:hypothetical protein